MEEAIPNQLKEAADLIKSGKIAAARNILVPLLRRDDQIEEAWYLLSFTLASHEKRTYALNQALKINPRFTRASDRLHGLEKGKKVEDGMLEDEEDEAGGVWKVSSKTKPLPELASFEEEASDTLEDLSDLQAESEFTAPFYESAFEEDEEEVKAEKVEEKKSKRSSALRRRLIIGILFFLIVLLLLFGGGNLLSGAPAAENSAAPSETLPPTPQGFRTLPPTWTPQIEESESGLVQPTATAILGEDGEEADDG